MFPHTGAPGNRVGREQFPVKGVVTGHGVDLDMFFFPPVPEN